MGWQLRRGLLNPVSGRSPGSAWWRAVNESLLRDTCEASALAFGLPGVPRTAGVAATLDFIREPTARAWYRAHNLSIATGYLANEDLARTEGRVERFFINLVLVRVLYAHALVAEPRLALGWLAPVGRLIGDPRLGMTGIFLSLSRVLPDRYPLDDDLSRYVDAENGLGHLLDVGIIVPRGHAALRLVSRRAGAPGAHARCSPVRERHPPTRGTRRTPRSGTPDPHCWLGQHGGPCSRPHRRRACARRDQGRAESQSPALTASVTVGGGPSRRR